MPVPINVQASTNVFIETSDSIFSDGKDGSTALKATPTVALAKKTIWDGTAFQLSKQAVSGAITALTGIDSTLTIAQYLATIPTLTDTNWRSLLLSMRGELITSNIDLSGALTSITVADSGSTTVTGQSGQSIITGTPTTGSFVSIAPTGDSSFSARVSGTFVGTLQFERTVDNVSWNPIGADVAGTNFSVSQATSVGSFHGNASSCVGVRVRCLTLVSGSPSVQLMTGSGVNTIKIGNPMRLFDAVSGMVATIKAASTPATATDTAIVVSNRDVVTTTAKPYSLANRSSSTSATANTWTQITVITQSSLYLFVNNPVGATASIDIGFGASGSEIRILLLLPGKSTKISSRDRISVRCATASQAYSASEAVYL